MGKFLRIRHLSRRPPTSPEARGTPTVDLRGRKAGTDRGTLEGIPPCKSRKDRAPGGAEAEAAQVTISTSNFLDATITADKLVVENPPDNASGRGFVQSTDPQDFVARQRFKLAYSLSGRAACLVSHCACPTS